MTDNGLMFHFLIRFAHISLIILKQRNRKWSRNSISQSAQMSAIANSSLMMSKKFIRSKRKRPQSFQNITIVLAHARKPMNSQISNLNHWRSRYTHDIQYCWVVILKCDCLRSFIFP